MSKDIRMWVAFVIGLNKETNKTVASFLSFEARNKFMALQEIQKALPESHNWVLSNGDVVPFTILTMHQCKPEEVNDLCELYVDRFAEMTGHEPNFEGLWSKPSPKK